MKLLFSLKRKYCKYLEISVVSRVFSANLVSVEVKLETATLQTKFEDVKCPCASLLSRTY